jgi:hypothetical protein
MPVRFPRTFSRRRFTAPGVVAACLVAIAAEAQAQQPTRPDTVRRQTHVVRPGDTLWDLAHTFLGDPYRWPEIFRLNTGTVANPHWIYPGEILRLPLAAPESTGTTAMQPASVAAARAPRVNDESRTVFTPEVRTLAAAPPLAVVTPPPATLKFGEYLAAPWVDQRGGPRGAGKILRGADIPGIGGGAARDRLQDYDRVLFAPPVGQSDSAHTRYLACTLGPLIEGFGQIVVPTGVLEVTRAPEPGVAGIGMVVNVFGEIQTGQMLLPFDSSAAELRGAAAPIAGGQQGTVRWITGEPVLPTVQHYIVVDLGASSGLRTGDELEIYRPVQHPTDPAELATPEETIARAQVLRVTPEGATAVITDQTQPAIHKGVAVRIVSKMP